MKRITASAIMCIGLFFTHAHGANSQNTLIQLQDAGCRYPIGTKIEYLEDRDGNIDIRKIIKDDENNNPKLTWSISNSQFPSFGFSSSVFWIRFQLKDQTKEINHCSLVLDYPHIDDIRLYEVNERGHYTEFRAGDHLAFQQRQVAYRNFVFPLEKKRGVLIRYYMRIATSSSVNLPLWILSNSELSKKIANEQLLLGLYYGLILVIAFYNLFIFISIRDWSYLFYILWIMGYGMYQITLNGLSFQYFWPNAIWWANHSLPIFIFFGASAGLQFGRSFLKTRENHPFFNWLFLGLISFNTVCFILCFFLPYAILIRIGTFIVIVVTTSLLAGGITSLAKGYRAARFYVTAFSSLFIGISIYALKTFGLLPVNFFTNWSQQIGSAIEVTLLSLALADRINIMKREKREAQEKYRKLFESSQDIIFTLDEKWNFITINNSVSDHLRLNPEEVKSRNFLDLIYIGGDEEEVTRKLVKEKMESFAIDRKPISFKTQFKMPLNNEPKEMQVTMEFISIDGRDEILGKASSIQEDILMKYFECERQRFSIGNYFTTAEDISYRVTRNLSKFMDSKNINLLRIALREIIINAIEHGNLNITYEEKTEALMKDNYFDIICKRQNDPSYSGRRVEIFYSIDSEKVAFKITDQGEGFDYQRFLCDNSCEANTAQLAHGRGISMSKNIFDEIRYNRKGNQVLLVKNFYSQFQN